MGYSHVQVLDGGINRWTTVGYSTEWGVNVPSKDFGEKMEVVHHVPTIYPEELYARQQRGEKMIILDSRRRKNTGAPRSRAAAVPQVASWRCVSPSWCLTQMLRWWSTVRAHAAS